jgi:glutaminyl-tRNA synthetase
MAQESNGNCYLRYDDTNPETESHVYIDSIADTLKWMGYIPWKIT